MFAIKIADEFLESGTIVTTVGFANKQREEKRATPGPAALPDGRACRWHLGFGGSRSSRAR